MFHKLRLRLMLVNISVIFVLFSLLITGTYFFVQGKMEYGRERMLRRVAADILSGERRPPGPGPGPLGGPEGSRPVLFHAIVNSAGSIIDTSPYAPLSFKQLSEIINQAYGAESGTVTSLDGQAVYAFHQVPLPGHGGILFVFMDYQWEREQLQILVSALGIIGLICMAFSLLVSYFMANKAMTPIRQAWQQQQNFLADASHELRTPLAVIQANLDVVRDAGAETIESQSCWLNNVYEEVQQMTQLVESLLFLSQADSRQQLLKKKIFSLDQALLAVVGAFRPAAAAKDVKLVVQTAAEIVYHGDEVKLRQTIGILLDNAIRHTPANGKIKIVLEANQQNIVLSVTDTGEGILDADMEKIFLRFYQSDTSRSKGGAGLGLAIAKWIVENHGGMIKVISIPGKGSTFTICLPHASRGTGSDLMNGHFAMLGKSEEP